MSTWIKVELPDELREGLTVEIRPCGFCGKTERLILLRPVNTDAQVSVNGAGDVVPQGDAWKTSPGLCIHPRRPFDPSAAIATGRLFRLADEPPAVGETTTRKLERAQ